MSVSNLRDRRVDTGRPVERYTITVTRYVVDENPIIEVAGLGETIRQIDVDRLANDMSFAAISFGNKARREGVRGGPLAVVLLRETGVCNVTSEMTKLGDPGMLDWLLEGLGVAAAELKELHAEEVARQAAD